MEKEFYTDDIQLTAFLLTQGIKIIDITEDNPTHFTFVLSNPNRCHELKQEYINNALAPAQELFSKRELLIGEIKKIKSRSFLS